MLVKKLPECRTVHLRRLAKFLRIAKWWKLRRAELVDEITWKLDPWKDSGGMYG